MTILNAIPAGASVIDVTDPSKVTYTTRHQYHSRGDGLKASDLTPDERADLVKWSNCTPLQRFRANRPVVLDRLAIEVAAPSVFAESQWSGMGHRYKFVPTSHVLDVMESQDMLPVRVVQSRCRIEGKGEFTKHLIRFRHRDSILAGCTTGSVIHRIDYANPIAEVHESVLVNSHDGTSTYKLWAGVLRMVCNNGLMVDGATFGDISVRHSGGHDFDARIVDATKSIVNSGPQTMKAIEGMKQVTLLPQAAQFFAEAALEVRGDERLKPDQILAARRDEDRKSDLWTNFNNIQENLMKGGIRPYGNRVRGRKPAKTRSVASVDSETRLNRALWTLAEKMATLAK